MPVLLIDAYNVLHVVGVLPPELAGPDLSGLAVLIERSRFRRDAVTLFCDGRAPVPRPELPRGIRAKWSGPDREADDLIIAQIRTTTTPRRCLVVTSDRQILKEAQRRRCAILRSEAFMALLARDAAAPPTAGPALSAPLPPDALPLWLQEEAARLSRHAPPPGTPPGERESANPASAQPRPDERTGTGRRAGAPPKVPDLPRRDPGNVPDLPRDDGPGKVPVPPRDDDPGKVPVPPRDDGPGKVPVPPRDDDPGKVPVPPRDDDPGKVPVPPRDDDPGKVPVPPRGKVPVPLQDLFFPADVLNDAAALLEQPFDDPDEGDHGPSDPADQPATPLPTDPLLTAFANAMREAGEAVLRHGTRSRAAGAGESGPAPPTRRNRPRTPPRARSPILPSDVIADAERLLDEAERNPENGPPPPTGDSRDMPS